MEVLAFLVGWMSPFIFVIFLNMMLDKKKFLRLLLFSIVLALIGAVITLFKLNQSTPNFYLALFNPLYSLIVFKAMAFFFKKEYHREPQKAAKTSDKRLRPDRLFTMQFLTLTTIVPLGIFCSIYTK